MQIFNFSKTSKRNIFASLASIVFLFCSINSQAQLKYAENRDYETLPVVIEETEEPKVIEFFWFGCPHCNKLRGFVEKWLEDGIPEGVEFEIVPATLESDRWSRPSRAFYTMKFLKKEELFNDYFDAIFKEKKNALLANDAAVKNFFTSRGVTEEEFNKAWNSLEVKQNVARAADLFGKSGIDGVPAFIVNGKYSVPLKGDESDGYKKTFDIIHSLLRK
ncbi:MAG: thiol:disulfide interchange protein DsbA/DsbL [Cardiobacteriaceae bacterium]|nr:thiol:disulfide interchange protein DsbA/DsbL [Cardiobacteriaceae bacterium]